MKRGLAIAFAAICATAAQPAPAAAADDLVLEPTSDWVLDYAPERCSLIRKFGSGRDEVRMRIDSFGSWIGTRILLVGRPIPRFNRPSGSTKYRFTPDQEDREVRSLHGTSDGQPAIAFGTAFVPLTAAGSEPVQIADLAGFLALPSLEEFERQTNSLSVRAERGPRITLNTGNMARPLRALRECIDNLHQSWGLDPAIMKTLSRPAMPRPETVQRVQARYPSTMVLRGVNAFVPVRVMVDAEGAATACVVQVESVRDEFKRAVCDGLARGYVPALDAAGRPVASVYQTSVFYLLRG